MKQKQIIAQDLHSSASALSSINFRAGQTFYGKGTLPMENFPRLVQEAQEVQEHLEPFQVEWECSTWIDILPSGTEQYRLKLQAKTTLPVTCQRCLDDYQQVIDVNSQFVLLDTQAEVDDFPLENDEEDALLNSQEFNLLELIEDELLLGMPLVPKHADENCQNQLVKMINEKTELSITSENLEEIDPKTGKLNPFSQLKKLKLN